MAHYSTYFYLSDDIDTWYIWSLQCSLGLFFKKSCNFDFFSVSYFENLSLLIIFLPYLAFCELQYHGLVYFSFGTYIFIKEGSRYHSKSLRLQKSVNVRFFFSKNLHFSIREKCDQYSSIVQTVNYLWVATAPYNFLHCCFSSIHRNRNVFWFIMKFKIFFEKLAFFRVTDLELFFLSVQFHCTDF